MALSAKARHQAAIALVALLIGCSDNPPVPDWQQNSFDALQAFRQLYLAGDTKAAEVEFTHARAELTATGRADLVARAELVRCAARVASLVLEPCSGFEALRDGAGPEELAYADYLEGRAQRAPGNEPLARLVAFGVLFRRRRI